MEHPGLRILGVCAGFSTRRSIQLIEYSRSLRHWSDFCTRSKPSLHNIFNPLRFGLGTLPNSAKIHFIISPRIHRARCRGTKNKVQPEWLPFRRRCLSTHSCVCYFPGHATAPIHHISRHANPIVLFLLGMKGAGFVLLCGHHILSV